MRFDPQFHWCWEPDGWVFGVLFGYMTVEDDLPVFFGVGIGICALMIRVGRSR